MQVYLHELDSIRESDKVAQCRYIERGQQALFRELVKNGNTVVLSLNQLIDSEAFLFALRHKESYEAIMKLWKMGRIRVSTYGGIRTASQFMQDRMEGGNFRFSALPEKFQSGEEAEQIRKTIVNAVKYNDAELIHKIPELDGMNDVQGKCKLTKEEIDYLYRYVKMILELSSEFVQKNKEVKEEDRVTLSKMIQKIISLYIDEKDSITDTDKAIHAAIRRLNSISEESEQEKLNGRSFWYKHIEQESMCKWIVDICYNYTVEESVLGASRHCDIASDEKLKEDFAKRIHEKIEYANSKSKEKGNLAEEVKLPNWKYAVRMLEYNKVVEDKLFGKKKGKKGHGKDKNREKYYDEAIKEQRRRWIGITYLSTVYRLFVAVFFVLLFYAVDQGLGIAADVVGFETLLNSTFINVIVWGLISSGVSEVFHLPDILTSMSELFIRTCDMVRFIGAKTGYFSKRKRVKYSE